MARIKDHEKALALRKQGKSYSQIKEILGVSKSTLSYWLRAYPLSKERIRELRDHNERRIERFRETMRFKRAKRLDGYYEEQKKIIFPFSERELYLAGLFLYWGEGSKSGNATISVANTDPSAIKFFITWFTKSLGVPKKKLRVYLHLYNDMNINIEINFWSEVLQISKKQFNKPYIKKTSSDRISHKGSFGHGTCTLLAYDARLCEKVLMALKVLSDQYNKS